MSWCADFEFRVTHTQATQDQITRLTMQRE